MLELLWQIGILSAVLIFGAKIGLAMGFSGMSNKSGVLIAVGYGLGIYILSLIVSGNSGIFYQIISQYNSILFGVMSVIIIYAGLHTIREWKVNQKNHAKATCAAMIAPCPCCFGSVITAIVLAAPIIGASSALIGQYAAVLIAITIVGVFFASGRIVKLINKPYPILLGNFMLFVGLYFLASVIVLPNINKVLQSPMKGYDVSSVNTLIYIALFMILLIIVGFYKVRRDYMR